MEVIIDGIRYVPDRNVAIKLGIWYMHDNHLFTKLHGNTIDKILAHAESVRKESPYGMLCPITVLGVNDKELRRVGPPVHDQGIYKPDRWQEMLPEWRAAVEADVDVMRIIKSGATRKKE